MRHLRDLCPGGSTAVLRKAGLPLPGAARVSEDPLGRLGRLRSAFSVRGHPDRVRRARLRGGER